MALSDEAQKIINEESSVLSEVARSLGEQRSYKLERLRVENARARELTAELVKTRREEDKALLASDEAVSHGLKDKQKQDAELIQRMLKNPYFARMVLEEQTPQGIKEFEYKIGLVENSSCRVIDWRKAPIARLYYEYKQGDEYSEEIQGRERTGTIRIRRLLDTKDCILSRVTCPIGDFSLRGGEWRINESSVAASAAVEPGQENLLPQIAPRLDPSQFALIAETTDQAVLIQGVAGSGKTTVALHRLAWLFAKDNAPSAGRTLVLVLSKSLKTYLSSTLPSLGVEGVRVITLLEWYQEILRAVLPHLTIGDGADNRINRPAAPVPASIDRLKRSVAMLLGLEELANERKGSSIGLEELLIELLSRPERILAHDETKLINRSLIQEALARNKHNRELRVLDYGDDALMIRASEILGGGIYFKDGNFGKYEHLFADEVQDLGPADLACILGALDSLQHVTLVGDTDQKMDSSSTFPGWDKLRRFWSLKESLAHFVSLNLSYRCTYEIQKLADFVLQKKTEPHPDARHGRVPIWFKCLTERRGIEAAREWLLRAFERYPNAITAVICKDQESAKHVLGLLKPQFGMAVRPGSESSFSFEGGIVVSHIRQVRGLEFANVLLWNPSQKDYPSDSTTRNLLYVAISRARENVCLVTWGRHSPLLPNFNSPLVRGHDLAQEELAQAEDLQP